MNHIATKLGAFAVLPLLLLSSTPVSAHGITASASGSGHANAALAAKNVNANAYAHANANASFFKDASRSDATTSESHWWDTFGNWMNFWRNWKSNHDDNATSTPAKDAVTVTGVTGPTALAVGEDGSWTVDAKSSASTTLSYSVTWGDENMQPSTFAAMAKRVSSSATFTHEYAAAGTYTATFTVTDTNGRSDSKDVKVHVSDAAAVAHIDSASPASGMASSTVTLTGTGFTDATKVTVGGHEASDLSVTDDGTLTFTVPSIKAGDYNIRVWNDAGRSNAVAFTVTSAPPAAHLSVSGIDAPATLAVNEDGTWTVHATGATGTLHYSVKWGDEPTGLRALFAASAPVQSSSTFTHAYAQAGTYTPTFTISDDSGHQESVGASVVVNAE
jgi:hypothetical protein